MRRKLYPRIKCYGGLYCPRRPIKDDSLIREIEKTARSQWGSQQDCIYEFPPVKGFEDEYETEENLRDQFEFPAYMKRDTILEPKFAFGGGIPWLTRMFDPMLSG